MNIVGVKKAREQMGASLGAWVTSAEMAHDVSEGSWYFLSGIPSPAVNMAMIHEKEESIFTSTLGVITASQIPTVMFLAGEAQGVAERLLKGWKQISVFTLMKKDLSSSGNASDARVSLISEEDTHQVGEILAKAFNVQIDTYDFLLNARRAAEGLSHTWVLKVDGVVVSTVTTILVDESVVVWCMATPPQFARRGYAKALLAEVLERSITVGAKVGLLSASAAGKLMYDANGWESLEEWDVYLKL